MDYWRHFPSYQLERRADLFFSLYLPKVLAEYVFPVQEKIIPEFPIQRKILGLKKSPRKSYKIDYIALSKDKDKDTVLFVELKTDMESRCSKQDGYLKKAKEVGLWALLNDLLEIFQAPKLDSKSRKKYFCLLQYLKSMGIFDIPDSMKDFMSRPNFRGVTKESRGIKIKIPETTKCKIVYVQPHSQPEKIEPDIAIITFQDFSKVVKGHDDPISQRFALSLDKWANNVAGEGY